MTRVAATLTLAALALMVGCDEGERVPATPRALAAVALERTGVEPTLVEGSTEDGYTRASIEFDDGRQRLVVGVRDGAAAPDEPCDDRGTCAVISTDDGDVSLYWEDEEPEEDPGLVNVTFAADDGLHGASYAGDPITGDPRDLDLGVDVDDMVAIVTDDRFGTSTTEELAGAAVPGWVDDPTELTPQVIAHDLTLVHQTLREVAAYEVDAGAYGEGSIGATVELDDGVTLTGYSVPEAAAASLCPTGWTCETRQDGEVLVGTPAGQVDDYLRPAPLENLVALLGDDGRAAVILRDGPPVGPYDPTEAMEGIARLIGDVERVDAEDVAEIDAIWEQR